MQSKFSKFTDGNWHLVKKELREDVFLKIRDNIFTEYLDTQGQKEGVMDIITYLYPIGSGLYDEDRLLAQDKKYYCQAILYKINGQKIPIFIHENLDEATKKLKEVFHFLVDDSSTKNWKFAIASNYKKWIFFGMDTMTKEAPLCSSEIFDITSVSKRKLLEPFLRNLMTILHFDAEELYRIDEENKAKHACNIIILREINCLVKMKNASFEDLMNNLIERWEKVGGEKAETAIAFIKTWVAERAARRNKKDSEEEKPQQEENTQEESK